MSSWVPCRNECHVVMSAKPIIMTHCNHQQRPVEVRVSTMAAICEALPVSACHTQPASVYNPYTLKLNCILKLETRSKVFFAPWPLSLALIPPLALTRTCSTRWQWGTQPLSLFLWGKNHGLRPRPSGPRSHSLTHSGPTGKEVPRPAAQLPEFYEATLLHGMTRERGVK